MTDRSTGCVVLANGYRSSPGYQINLEISQFSGLLKERLQCERADPSPHQNGDFNDAPMRDIHQ